MRKRIGLALLAGALLWGTGCASLLERSYVSATAHVDYYYVPEEPSTLRAETYQGLVNAILYLVESYADTGTIRLYNYTGDVEADLANACAEIRSEDPLGAYAVQDIRYDTTRIVTYYEVNLDLLYSRSAQEVEGIVPVTGLGGLQTAFSEAVAALDEQAAIRAARFSWTEQELSELFWTAYYGQPLYAVPGSQVSFTFYPDTGTQRIIELSILWPQTVQELAQRAERLERAALQALAALPAAGQAPTLSEVAGALGSTAVYDPQGSPDPEQALAGDPANGLGLALAMELLCHQAGLEAFLVQGASPQGQEPWLIVEQGEGYRHLLVSDLAAFLVGGLGELPLYTDQELAQMGHSWPQSFYPVCSD